jgi:thiazole synthase ThiGH ThiG subunit
MADPLVIAGRTFGSNDDLIVANRLIDAGTSAVMPLAAPIGSGMGIQNLANLRILRDRVIQVPPLSMRVSGRPPTRLLQWNWGRTES